MADHADRFLSKRRVGLIAILCVVGFAVAYLVPPLTTAWVRSRLVKLFATKMHARLEIGSLQFSPLKGTVEIGDMRLYRHSRPTSFTVEAAHGLVDLDMSDLILEHRLTFRQIHVQRPNVRVLVDKPRRPASTSGTLARLRQILRGENKAASDRVTSAIAVALRLSKFRVGELRFDDGFLGYTLAGAGREPFDVVVNDLDYVGKEVALDSPLSLLTRADYEVTAHAGAPFHVVRKGLGQEPSFEVRDVSIAYLDRLFDQSDSFAFEDGRLSLETERVGDRSRFGVDITGLKLRSERGTTTPKDIAFIPIEKLNDFVSERGGNLKLSVTVGQHFELSEDLDELVRDFLMGLWVQVLKEAGGLEADELISRGIDNALDVLRMKDTQATRTKQLLGRGASKLLEKVKDRIDRPGDRR